MASLVGEIDLAPVPLTMNKSDFARDGQAWVAIEKRMHALLAPIAKRLAEDELAPPPASALKTAEQVRRLLSKVLKLTQREEMFRGLAAARPQTGTRPEAAERDQPTRDVIRAPARPPAENEQKRSGFGRIVIRPLDPNIRSQSVIEQGVTTVVINSRHPMFIKRKGDIWYQLETAAREIFKSLEGANIGDYERRVNEVVLLAFQIRGRQRQARSLRAASQLPLITT